MLKICVRGESDNHEKECMISDDENTSVVNRKDAVNIIFVRGEVDDIRNLYIPAI